MRAVVALLVSAYLLALLAILPALHALSGYAQASGALR